MKSKLLISAVAAAVLSAPLLASAQPQNPPPNRPNPGERRPGQMRGQEAGQPGEMRQGPLRQRMRVLQDLGLSDVQKTDLRKARETAQRERLRKTTDLKIARLDLQSLMRAEKVDEKAIAAKLSELQAAQGALLKIRVDGALAMKRILTPEQQKKIAAARGARGGQRLGHRMQRMKMRGGPFGQGGRGLGRGRVRGEMGRPGLPGGIWTLTLTLTTKVSIRMSTESRSLAEVPRETSSPQKC